MKIFWGKIKKSNKVLLTLYALSFLGYLISLIFFIKSLLSLAGIETILRIVLIIIFIIWFIFFSVYNLVNLILKRNKRLIVLCIITLLLTITFSISAYVIDTVYNKIDNITASKYTVYTTNLIALNDTKITNSSKLGMISNKDDIEGHVLAKELIKNKKLKSEVVKFDDYYEMLSALYNKEIDGMFVSSNYEILFSSEDTYANIATETYVVYKYSKKMKTQENLATSKKPLTEPFTVLLMGVDSPTDGLNANQAFNGDTLMVITFNPKTLSATMFSIPRDTYVPIACNNNQYNKINSSAAYGTNCVINTVQNLIGIDIDYYAKINFRGVIDLVEALGGINVDVEQPDYDVYVKKYGKGKLCESNHNRSMVDLVCMDTGMQKLNGEQALAYSRNRHGFLQSDIARNKHQQQVVEAIAQESIKLKSFNDFKKILDAVSKNIATNMTTNQILSFYDILKDMFKNSINENTFVTINKTYLEYYSLPVYYSNMYVSAIGYYPGSLDAIKNLMKENLGLKEKEVIKTFAFKHNEEYEANLTGKGITTGEKLELLPDFTGSSQEYVSNWCSTKGIKFTSSGTGSVIYQNMHAGALVRNISSLYVELGGFTTAQVEVVPQEEQASTQEEEKQEETPTVVENIE